MTKSFVVNNLAGNPGSWQRRFHSFKFRMRRPLWCIALRKQCKESGCIFIHVPKSAGISIRRSLSLKVGAHTNISKYHMVFTPRDIETYFKFSFVRNPWDRLVSAFLFLKKGGKDNQTWVTKHLAPFNDFDTFVRKWVTPENVWSFTHFRPQFHFVCLENKHLTLDFVGFYENLAADFAFVCKKLNVRTTLPEENRNRDRIADYREYYTEETRRIVEEVYAGDIELLGYSFDNSSLPTQIANRDKLGRPGSQTVEESVLV